VRFIDLNKILADTDAEVLSTLESRDRGLIAKDDTQKQRALSNGSDHWRPAKEEFERIVGRKCWYTESENDGCLNDLEHFRPKGRVMDGEGNVIHWYWFLGFNAINYRISAQLPNRLNANGVLEATGGKGDRFPLQTGSSHGANLAEIDNELPVLLDPCCEEDTKLLVFQPDGRPVISPQFSDNQIAAERVRQSNLLLNLDYPTFNESREKLYNKIRSLVEDRGDRYFDQSNVALDDIKQDLRELMLPEAKYSRAAECYIRGFRDRVWVEDLFFE
jgi:hypothetical protein